MSSTQADSTAEIASPKAPSFDMKLEIVVIPVSDVDRAKRFYADLGWRLDADYDSGKDFRVLQFTPPGSGCSVIFGKNVTAAAPGSAQGLYLIVSDIEAARADLLARGVEISEVFHDAAGVYAGQDEPYLFGRLRTAGRDPEHRSYRSFASFRDPDRGSDAAQRDRARPYQRTRRRCGTPRSPRRRDRGARRGRPRCRRRSGTGPERSQAPPR